MSKVIQIENVARIEGHAGVQIYVDSAGNVDHVEYMATEPSRSFETIFESKHASEIPRLAARICGICYTAHNICACLALEDAWGTEVPPTGKSIRRMLLYANTLSSHALHFAFLAAPGLFIEGANRLDDLKVKHPNLVEAGVNLRMVGQEISEVIAGRKVHTVISAPGGVMGNINAQKQEKIIQLLDSADGPMGVLETYANRLLSKKREYLQTFGRIETHFLCLKQREGLDLYDGPVELIMASGESRTMQPAEILDVVTEREVDYSYVRHPYLTALGPESGQFRVGPLARLQHATWDSPSLREFRHTFGKGVVQATMGFHFARIPEMYECIRQMRKILSAGLDGEVKNAARPREGVGVGVVAAPRGILLHEYETDGKGIIRRARVIAPTTFHQGSIELSTLEAARSVLNGNGGDCTKNQKVEIEQVIRAYDPCMSCAGATQLRVIKRQPSGDNHA